MPSNIQHFGVLRAVTAAAAVVRCTAPCALARLAVVMAAWAGPMVAQETAGDKAWQAGRMSAARSAYERALAADSTVFRPNLRLAVILSREGKLAQALRCIARARTANADDFEARLLEAQVMAWAGRYGDAIARYDSLLATLPGSVDATLGRARARAWLGDRPTAAKDYRAVLATEPRNADALVGLGYLYHWQGREVPAERPARQALAADSVHQAARDLLDAVRATTRVATELSGEWSNDSDHSTVFRQRLDFTTAVGPGVQLVGGVAVRQLSDRVRDATAVGSEAGLTLGAGRLEIIGAAGASRLSPDNVPDRTVATYRGRVRWQPLARVGVSAAYARSPFDEIAALMERGLNQESLQGGLEITPVGGLSLRGGAGAAWISDGNRRTGVDLGLAQRVVGGLVVGGYARTLAYLRPGLGYFSPDRFRLLEGTAGYGFERSRWSAPMSGGLGAQWIGRTGDARTAWHLEGRLSRRWGAGNRLDLSGSVTNNALSSTSGAFRTRTAGVMLRVGF